MSSRAPCTQTPPLLQVPYAQIKSIIEQELKRPLSEVFSSIDEVPLATASVAQVRLCTLRLHGFARTPEAWTMLK